MKKRIILFLYLLLCGYIVLNGTDYVLKLHTNNMYSDKPVMKDSVYFVFSDSGIKDLSFLQDEEVADDITLLYQDVSAPSNYHVLYSVGEMDLFYGQYAQNHDFNSNDTGMIPGKKGSTEYTYEVLGYLEDYGIPIKENSVFLLDTKLSEVFGGALFILTSGRESHAEAEFEGLQQLFEKNGIPIQRVNASSVIFGSYEDNQYTIYIIAGVFFCVMFVIMSVAFYLWRLVNRTYHNVLVMFGDNHPYLRVVGPFLISGGISWVLWITIYLFWGKTDPYHLQVCCGISSVVYVLLFAPVLLNLFTEKNSVCG